MITTDKVTEIFCILDEFRKNLDAELTKNLHIAPIDEGYPYPELAYCLFPKKPCINVQRTIDTQLTLF